MKLFGAAAVRFALSSLLVACAALPLAGSAQNSSLPRLRGYVVTPEGLHVVGAEVHLTGQDNNTATLTTDRYGMFLWRGPEGRYDVVVNFSGFGELHQKDVLFSKDAVATFSLGVDRVGNFAEPLGSSSSSAPAPTASLTTVTPFQVPPVSPVEASTKSQSWEYGVLLQGGNGLTEDRNGFHFLSAGVHVGKVLTPELGHGVLKGNFEYAVEVYPFWQSYTPKFQKASCFATPTAGTTLVGPGLYCSALYTVGGTYTGVTVTPIILRWNFTHGKKFMPWVQAAGGSLWTNHKYPAFGSSTLNLTNDGPNSDASVWNFTPQGGVGFHYFVKPARSVDFSANAVHISSASLGDKNPGVNASVQFTLGYTWWKR